MWRTESGGGNMVGCGRADEGKWFLERVARNLWFWQRGVRNHEDVTRKRWGLAGENTFSSPPLLTVKAGWRRGAESG